MEHTWTKDFYQETDPAKRQQILKEYIGEEEAWEEEYRARLWTARYGQRRLQKDEFVKCLMELKYLAEGTSLDPGGDSRKMGARILSTLCLAEAMQSDEGYQKILADELYNVFLKFIQVSRGGRGFTSLVFGMGQLSEEFSDILPLTAWLPPGTTRRESWLPSSFCRHRDPERFLPPDISVPSDI